MLFLKYEKNHNYLYIKNNKFHPIICLPKMYMVKIKSTKVSIQIETDKKIK